MYQRTRVSLILCIGMTVPVIRWIAQPARGQEGGQPTTQSLTTRPAEELPVDSPIRSGFAKLADPDPKIRDQARQDLMGIALDDLPRLRQLVIEHKPISPDQSAALRDIVLQSYLANDRYSVKTDSGDVVDTNSFGTQQPFFLGLLWTPQIESDGRLGVTIDERLPGFPSYRFLRKGDMVLGIFVHLTNPLPRQPDWSTPNQLALINAIKTAPKTQEIVLQVLRDGEMMEVPVRMAPRPMDADPLAPGSLKVFTAARADRAESYWQENFAPLLAH